MNLVPERLNVVVAVVSARPGIAWRLLRGVRERLQECHVSIASGDVFSAPDEPELIARSLGRSGSYEAIVCVGCVIESNNTKAEVVGVAAEPDLISASLSTAMGAAAAMPTTHTDGPVRGRNDAITRGKRAADACLRTILALCSLQQTLDADRSADADARRREFPFCSDILGTWGEC